MPKEAQRGDRSIEGKGSNDETDERSERIAAAFAVPESSSSLHHRLSGLLLFGFSGEDAEENLNE